MRSHVPGGPENSNEVEPPSGSTAIWNRRKRRHWRSASTVWTSVPMQAQRGRRTGGVYLNVAGCVRGRYRPERPHILTSRRTNPVYSNLVLKARLVRIVVTVCSVIATLGLSMLPAEHVHESYSGRAIVHRHAIGTGAQGRHARLWRPPGVRRCGSALHRRVLGDVERLADRRRCCDPPRERRARGWASAHTRGAGRTAAQDGDTTGR